jgi:hypothetical protein
MQVAGEPIFWDLPFAGDRFTVTTGDGVRLVNGIGKTQSPGPSVRRAVLSTSDLQRLSDS